MQMIEYWGIGNMKSDKLKELLKEISDTDRQIENLEDYREELYKAVDIELAAGNELNA
jgi:hypothetical protein